MKRHLDYLDNFLKDLRDLPPKHFKQIISKVLSLKLDPFPNDYKQLHDKNGLLRVDSGEYRIIYSVTNDSVQILLVGKRNDDEVYKLLDRKF
jgi:mRNA interferase RelE/StbE